MTTHKEKLLPESADPQQFGALALGPTVQLELELNLVLGEE